VEVWTLYIIGYDGYMIIAMIVITLLKNQVKRSAQLLLPWEVFVIGPEAGFPEICSCFSEVL